VAFSDLITEAIEGHPLITVSRDEVTSLPEGDTIIAAGPLASDALMDALSHIIGEERLSFFDAAAPIVEAESIDRAQAFDASRWGKGGDTGYLNCPLSQERYESLVRELRGAGRVTLRDFERRELFQACQPIEEIARTGPDALRFGPLKPVGLTDPRTGERRGRSSSCARRTGSRPHTTSSASRRISHSANKTASSG